MARVITYGTYDLLRVGSIGIESLLIEVGMDCPENGIIFDLNMSGEKHMRRRNEIFGCIPYARGAQAAQVIGNNE